MREDFNHGKIRTCWKHIKRKAALDFLAMISPSLRTAAAVRCSAPMSVHCTPSYVSPFSVGVACLNDLLYSTVSSPFRPVLSAKMFLH